MRVERYDYGAQFGDGLDGLVADLRHMLVGGDYILSAEVARFEHEFARLLGAGQAVGVNSGTDALVIAMRVLGIGPGDEVITHANAFYATAAAVVFAGATPVLVDADDGSYLIDARQIEAAVTSRTRAILPVHLYGKPTPMRPLTQLAGNHNLSIIEDAAQSHGAHVDGKAAGTHGVAGCFSFHPSKNLAAAGDGGAIVTDDADVAARARMHRNLGQDKQNHHVVLGMNSKLDAIQARVLRHKLERLDTWVRSRNAVAERYIEGLDGLPVTWQRVDGGETHAYHLFQIRTRRRDELLAFLRDAGIDAVVRYPTPIHLQAPFAAYGWRRGQFPVAERLADELLCLPIRPDLQDREIEYVVGCVREFFDGPARPRADTRVAT